MKRLSSVGFSRQTLAIVIPVVFGLLFVMFLFNRYVADYLRPDFSNAFSHSPPIVHVDVRPLDHIELWPADGGTVVVGRKDHWLMDDYSNVAENKPERLWYDGKLVATSYVGFHNYILSSNGEHYAYTEKLIDEDTESREQLIVDNVPYIDGGRMTVLYVPNSGDEPYYMCEDCGQDSGNALWHGHQKLADLDKDKRNSEDETAAFIITENEKSYCFINNTLGASILLSGRRVKQLGWNYCSPDAKHFVRKESRNTFLIGTKSVLFINDKKVAEGNIDDIHIGNDDLLSYSKSNGSGGGVIVWHGKRYTYHGYNSYDEWLVSPSQNNLLIPLSQANKKVWFLNGRKVGDIRGSDNLYLDDDALYAYRSSKL